MIRNIPLSNVSFIIKTVSNSFKELLITFSIPQKVQMCVLVIIFSGTEIQNEWHGIETKKVSPYQLLPLISKIVYNFSFMIERHEIHENIQDIQNINHIGIGMRATFPKELK